MLNYPITLEPDTNGTFLILFVDFPNVNSVAENREQIRTEALDALETALQGYFDRRLAVPLPSPAEPGQLVVTLSALSEAKVLLWNEMFAQQLKKADLARRLHVHNPQIDRLFDLSHASKLDFVEQAAKALGKRLSLSIVELDVA
ncbi:MAG: type II toxin-antitoxin system HicB family antitoxin [Pseudomonadota bacterium]|nr:type II toxin-antitoxin system HicB family antitoxin [Pseudomonadota bacterium]